MKLGFPNDSVSMQEALKLMQNIELPEKTLIVIDDYHSESKTYQMHSILINFLKEVLENKPENYKQSIYENAGQWYISRYVASLVLVLRQIIVLIMTKKISYWVNTCYCLVLQDIMTL